MDKQFCKLDEYSGKLLNPKVLPNNGDIVAVNDRPNTFGDGFILDLNVRGKDKQRLEKLVKRTVTNLSVRNLITQTRKAKTLLSEPRYIWDKYYPVYILFTPDNKPVGIQVKYYHYFRNRYPECSFYTDDILTNPKTVRVNNKLVGLWMAMMLSSTEGIKDG